HPIDLPRYDQTVRRFPLQHMTPLAFATIDTLLEPAAALALLENGFGHLRSPDVVFARPPLVERGGECTEGLVNCSMDRDAAVQHGNWRTCQQLYSSALGSCSCSCRSFSTKSLKRGKAVDHMRLSSSKMRCSAVMPSGDKW